MAATGIVSLFHSLERRTSMSPFLYHVSRLVSQHIWIDPYLICHSEGSDGTADFIATDDGWHGTLIAQHQAILDDEQYRRVDELLREVDFGTPLFRVQLHEELAVVRGVLRLPIFSEVRWKDDARAIIGSFTREWPVVESFVRRATGNEDLAAIIVSAKLQMKLHRASRLAI
jgi:hypothetical protein